MDPAPYCFSKEHTRVQRDRVEIIAKWRDPHNLHLLKMRCSDEMKRNFIFAGKCRTRPVYRKANYIVAYLRLFGLA